MTNTDLTDRVDRTTRRNELAQLTFSEGQLFAPKSGRELMDMANLMATAGFMVKDIYRNNAGACMGLIAVCAPYGLSPLQVSWKTYQASKNADAPIAYEAQVIVAMLNASGALTGPLSYELRGDGPSRQCIVTGELRGGGGPRELITPTVGQITTKNSPLWKSDPDQQLCYYGGRAWVRRFKPEMLLGIYSTDEIDIVPAGPEHARDVTPPTAPRRGGVVYREAAAPPTVDEVIEHHIPSPDELAAAEAAAKAYANEQAGVIEGGAV